MPFDRNTQFISSGSAVGFGAVDFWEWHCENCLDGSIRGSLAEFLIAKALGLEQTRNSWAAYDIDYHGYHIEVKSTSLFTSKHRKSVRDYVGNQRLVFSIEPKHVHISGSEWTSRKRNCDLYIFCLLSSPDAALLDAWTFYVVPTSFLDEHFPDNKTISISSLEKAGFEACPYSALLSRVDEILTGGNTMNEPKKNTITVRNDSEKNDLQRLLSTYQAASPEEKRAVWEILDKHHAPITEGMPIE